MCYALVEGQIERGRKAMTEQELEQILQGQVAIRDIQKIIKKKLMATRCNRKQVYTLDRYDNNRP